MAKEGDIPPYHGGSVEEPNMNDVLSGRGGRINAHPGNVQFRELVKRFRGTYLSPETKKLEKVKIAAGIVGMIRSMNPPGRFLREESKVWVEIGDEKARKKAGQAMREKTEETKPAAIQNPSPPLSAYSVQQGQAVHQTLQHNNPYLQMQQPFPLQGHMSMPQQPYSMGPMNAGLSTFPGQVLSNPTSPQDASQGSSGKNSPKSGLMTGNAVAFDREFNRMSSSSNPNSLRMSSMEGSIHTSSSTMARSSLSSRTESSRSVDNRASFQIMEPINDGREDSIASAWDDSWDQTDVQDTQSIDTSTRSIESERRRQFRNMKSEPSCLPSQLSQSENIGQLNENDLMKESLVSVEMQSIEMQKSIVLNEKSIQMDSIREFLTDTMLGDSESSLTQKVENKPEPLPSVLLRKPASQTRVESGTSGISDVSVKFSESSWPEEGNNDAKMPGLPPGMTDGQRQRIFSDYSNSNRSTTMMSDISVSMTMLDLDQQDNFNE